MAKGAYVGVNGTAHKIKNMYVGVNNVPHKVVKGYVGVNGVPKQFWPPVTLSGSWDHWTTIGSTTNPIIALNQYGTADMKFYKINNKIAYYGIFYFISTNYVSPIVISTDPDAVTIKDSFYGEIHTYVTTFVDSNNITWYVSGYNNWFVARNLTPEQRELLIDNTKSFYWQNDYARTLRDAAHVLVNRIYAIPFHQNYQVGQLYERIPACGDIRRTIRKIAGYQLAYNVDKYNGTESGDVGYKTYSNNIDAIINDIMTDIHQYGNDNGMIIVDVQDYFWDGSPAIAVYHGHYDSGNSTNKINYLENARILSDKTPTDPDQSGFEAKTMEILWDYGYGDDPEWTEYYWDWAFMERAFFIYVNADGTYETYGEEAGWGGSFSSDAFLGMTFNHYLITNLGVDL